MFIKLSTAERIEPIVINTTQIVEIDGSVIAMSNGNSHDLMKHSLQELTDSIFGDVTASPKATEHTSNLLNDLNKLVGGRGEARPTTDRKARLKSRLKDFTEDDLKLAATNLGNDEFMQGANDNNKRYGTIDYLLRTSANVNKWLEEQPQKKKGMF